MSAVLLGLLLGAGLVLTVSPALWPRTTSGARRHSGAADGLRQLLAQAGLSAVPVPALVIVSVLGAIVVAGLVFAVVGVVAIAGISGMAVLLMPWILVRTRARSRRRSTRVLWPDVVDHLVSAVRSGLALPDSVVTLAHSGPIGTRSSFANFERDYRVSGNFAYSVDRLKAEFADPVADRILETLRMSREVGGSELTTVLRNLAGYLREETAIRLEVESRQSWVMNSARLGAAAPWMILLLLSTRPEAAAAYNTAAGAALIGGGLVATIIAYRLMLIIGRIPEERRWFA
ncbi:type II secretion system F family protein [soil metagenome]